MIAGAYYSIYLCIVAVLSIYVFHQYYFKPSAPIVANAPKRQTNSNVYLLMIFMVAFIGFRPASGVFVDMMNYIDYYHAFYEDTPFHWDWSAENLVFDNLFAFAGSINLGTTLFFVLIATIYFGCAYWGIKRLFPKDTAMAYLCFLGAFSTFSYATNGIKAGAAASMFILALSFYQEWKKCVLLMIATIGFHHSMMMPIVAFVLAMVWKNPKFFFRGWVFCLICAIARVTIFQKLFAGITDESGADYLNAIENDWGGRSGFRIDFVIYSIMPIIVGYYAIYKHKIQSKTYELLLKVYLTTNGIWMLCMYAAFTNRIAYLSWIIYPIILIYPLLNGNWGVNRYKVVSKIFIAHLAFTIFMEFVYYS